MDTATEAEMVSDDPLKSVTVYTTSLVAAAAASATASEMKNYEATAKNDYANGLPDSSEENNWRVTDELVQGGSILYLCSTITCNQIL